MKSRIEHDVWTILWLVTMCVLAISAHAQEPTGKIAPADPVSVTARHVDPVPVIFANAIDPTMPMIYPAPLPSIGLAKIARILRADHAVAPKATKIANDEKPIVAEEPKEEK